MLQVGRNSIVDAIFIDDAALKVQILPELLGLDWCVGSEIRFGRSFAEVGVVMTMANWERSCFVVRGVFAASIGLVACGGSSSGNGTPQSSSGGTSSSSSTAVGTGGSGGSTSSSASGGADIGGSSSAFAGAGLGGATSMSASAGGASLGVGGTFSSYGGATSSGGTAASSSTTVPWAIVANGAPCSPIAARGCSSESKVAQMVCSAGSVWQWSADCATGTVCDPRPGLKVGQCVTPDAPCTSTTRTSGCASIGVLFSCMSPGFMQYGEPCQSGACTGDVTACAPFTACDEFSFFGPDNHDCSGLCTAGYSTDCRSPYSEKNGLYLSSRQVIIGVILPDSSKLRTLTPCPNTRVFWIWLESTVTSGSRNFNIRVPKAYKAVIVPFASVKSNANTVESAGCNLPADYVSPPTFDPYKGEAVMLVTTDSAAPAFRLQMY